MNMIQKSVVGFLLVVMVVFFFSYCKTDTKPKSTVDFKRTTNDVIVAPLAEADNLNPILYTSTYSRQAFSHIFQYLEGIDPETLELIPQLIKSRPEVTEGNPTGTRYTFEILEEAVWPNGEPVTAEDFIFTLKAIMNPKLPTERLRPYMAAITGVSVDPENTKKFTVLTGEQYILNEEVIGTEIPIMPRYVYDPQGLLNDIPVEDFLNAAKIESIAKSNAKLQQFADEFVKPLYARERAGVVGSGAYELVEWQTGQRIVLRKKANWWGDKLRNPNILQQAKVEEIIFQPMPDHTVAATSLKDEQLDVRSQIDPVGFEELKNNPLASERYNFHSEFQFAYFFIYLNNNNPILADKQVRRAIAHAIDVDEIIETVYDGIPERTVGPVHPAKNYYNKNLSPIPFDINKAKDILTTAGWSDSNSNGILDKVIDGQRTELELKLLYVAGRETQQNMALIIQEDARQAGISIEPIPMEATVIADNRRKRDYDMAFGGHTLSSTLDDFKQVWHSASDTPSGSNQVGFHNAEVDKIIEEIQRTMDADKRNQLYKRFQEIIYEEQPVTFLFVNKDNIAIHKRFEAETSPLSPGFFANAFVMQEIEN